MRDFAIAVAILFAVAFAFVVFGDTKTSRGSLELNHDWRKGAYDLGSPGNHTWPIPRAIYLEDDTAWRYDRAKKQWTRLR